MSTIDEINSKIDITDLVSELVSTAPRGQELHRFLSVHDNKHTPAFVVCPRPVPGDASVNAMKAGDLQFIMKRENLEFKEALDKLAGRAGVEIPTYSNILCEQKEAYDNLRTLLEDG